MNQERFSRRGFLKTAAPIAGGVTATALSRSRVLGANDRIRAGFIGVGLIGKRHLLDFMAQSDVEVAAISEVYQVRLNESVAASGGHADGYRDFRRMLDRSDIDVVVVSTPDHWHALMTILACASGKDVYVEKPLTHAVQEGRWMIDVARHFKRVVQVGTQQRSGSHYAECLQLIRGGHIGDVRSTRISAFRNVMPGFTKVVGTQPLSEKEWDLWLGPAPYAPFDDRRCIYHFRWFWDYSGGQTTNLLSHDLDIVQWVMQAQPSSVSAMGGRYSLDGIGETPDLFEAILGYPGFLTTWSSREFCAESSSCRGGLEFCGTKGRLVVNRGGFEVFPDPLIPADSQIPSFASSGAQEPRPPRTPRTSAMKKDGYQQIRDQFQPHVRNFLDCVKSRQQPVSDLESGHRTVTACHLANISMKLQRRIRWDSNREEILDDPEASQLLGKTYRTPWDLELKAVLHQAGSTS
ncbi:MAG: Gfo/Idh/MocA family oxidoreductase [Acidobacteriota bacterium]